MRGLGSAAHTLPQKPEYQAPQKRAELPPEGERSHLPAAKAGSPISCGTNIP